jgi:hypothetical protein
MARHGPQLYRLLAVNRAVLDVVDHLQLEFPKVPLLIVHKSVADARTVATRHLPNVAAFRDAVEQQARTHLIAVASSTQPVGFR